MTVQLSAYLQNDRAVYSYDLMIEHLMTTEGMEMEDAIEFIDFNTIRALPYVDNGPIVVYPLLDA